jgi:hypothetical protein
MINSSLVHSLFEYKDGNLLRKTTPSSGVNIGDIAGSLCKSGYLSTKIKNKQYMNHRIVWLMFNGNIPEKIDHIDGNRLNNRIENLRAVTPSQNSCNRKTPCVNTSGVKGVTWNKNNQTWDARITVAGKRIHLGSFRNIGNASAVVQAKRNEIHGEFANHN